MLERQLKARVGTQDVVRLLAVLLLCRVTGIRAWPENIYEQSLETLVKAANVTDCWVCTALPGGEMKLPMYGVAASNWNEDNGTWPEFWRANPSQGFCEKDTEPNHPLGPRFELQILQEESFVVLVSNNSCPWERGYWNTGPPFYELVPWGWSRDWINKTAVPVGEWDFTGLNVTYVDFCNKTQLQAYAYTGIDSVTNKPYGWYKAGNFLGANLTATSGPCKLPTGYWWLCGDGYSRKQLPLGWKGMCTIGYVTSQDRFYNQSRVPSGTLRTLWRKVRGVEKPPAGRGRGLGSSVRWLVPSIGVSELEKALVNISATIEHTGSSTLRALQQERSEITPNRMALDLLSWKEGGLCAVINQSCCSYVSQDGQVERDVQAIVSKAELLHEAALGDTQWATSDLWEELTS